MLLRLSRTVFFKGLLVHSIALSSSLENGLTLTIPIIIFQNCARVGQFELLGDLGRLTALSFQLKVALIALLETLPLPFILRQVQLIMASLVSVHLC